MTSYWMQRNEVKMFGEVYTAAGTYYIEAYKGLVVISFRSAKTKGYQTATWTRREVRGATQFGNWLHAVRSI